MTIRRGGGSLAGRTALALACGLAVCAPAAAAESDDIVASFFAIWDRNGSVTAEQVERNYAAHVNYYGQELSNAGVYADKRAFVRRWPDRRYTVVPGSVSKGCDAAQTRCEVGVTLAWSASSPGRGAAAHGLTRVSLTLARQDGALKIVRESGHPVRR